MNKIGPKQAALAAFRSGSSHSRCPVGKCKTVSMRRIQWGWEHAFVLPQNLAKRLRYEGTDLFHFAPHTCAHVLYLLVVRVRVDLQIYSRSYRDTVDAEMATTAQPLQMLLADATCRDHRHLPARCDLRRPKNTAALRPQ